MKKIFLTVLLLSFFIFGSGVFAQESNIVDSTDVTEDVIDSIDSANFSETKSAEVTLDTVNSVNSVTDPINPTEQPSQVFIKERETQKIKDLRLLYRNQVEVYRNSEKLFSIAKTNFEQVETLAALEEAVKATQTVMLDRSRVMITYLELIDAVLIETNGVELDLKNQTHKELFGIIAFLKIHQDEIRVSKDRDSMVLLSDNFEPFSENYESIVYKTLSLIRIGKIQEVQDKAEIIELDIIAQHNEEEVGSVQTSKRQRAYTEIERSFELINFYLVELNETFLQNRRDGFKRSFYQRILTDLGPIYVQISRSLDHLEELITL